MNIKARLTISVDDDSLLKYQTIATDISLKICREAYYPLTTVFSKKINSMFHLSNTDTTKINKILQGKPDGLKVELYAAHSSEINLAL